MRFTKKYDKENAGKTTGGGDYLRRFKKGETRVRFLQELDDWEAYSEHYTADFKTYPCPASDTGTRVICPGCSATEENLRRKTRRAATNLLLVDQQIVLPFKIPIGLADDLARRADRKGEKITERDYLIVVTGTGLETKYEFDAEDRYNVDIDSYKEQFWDIADVMEKSYAEIWGGDDAALVKADDEAEDDEPGFDRPSASETTSPQADDIEVDESELRSMSKSELVELFRTGGVDLPDDYRSMDREELLEHLLSVSA